MTYKVSVSSNSYNVKQTVTPKYKVLSTSSNSYNVKQTVTPKYKVLSTSGETVTNFSDLLDVDVSNLNDKYVLMYDSATQKYKMVNPDQVLSASSSTETTQPGLPSDFVNTLDVDLDDKIDLDAGIF
jgi:hypothetical protein